MADDAPSPHGLAALAISVSLVEVLLKHGVIDATMGEATLKEANLYAQAFCVDCAPEVERETQRILTLVRLPGEQAAVAEESSTAAAAADR